MDFSFVQMVHFTKLIKAGGRLREFNFRKLKNEGDGNQFSVDVADDRGDRLVFKMIQHNTRWEISSAINLPKWVSDVTADLVNTAENPVLDTHFSP